MAALLALGLSLLRSPLGLPLGLTVALALFVFFTYRYATRSRKFMPAGLMSIVSLVVILVLMLVMEWQS